MENSCERIEPSLLTPRAAAGLLAVSPDTLKFWRTRSHRGGPDFIRVGGRIRYSLRDLCRWLEEQTVRTENV